jgi:predicted amidohydrolase YtcJ
MPEITLHTSTLFDPKEKKFLEDISVSVNSETLLITGVFKREHAGLPDVTSGNDVDLRRKVVVPGFVDAHTHIFLYSYEYVSVEY